MVTQPKFCQGPMRLPCFGQNRTSPSTATDRNVLRYESKLSMTGEGDFPIEAYPSKIFLVAMSQSRPTVFISVSKI